LIAIIITATPS